MQGFRQNYVGRGAFAFKWMYFPSVVIGCRGAIVRPSRFAEKGPRKLVPFSSLRHKHYCAGGFETPVLCAG